MLTTLLILSLSYVVDFSILGISINKVAEFYSNQITTSINDMASEIKKEPHITDIDLTQDNDTYVLKVTFKFVTHEQLNDITIDGMVYDTFSYTYDDQLLITSIPFEIEFGHEDVSKKIKITHFTVDNKVYVSGQTITVFKGINYAVLAKKKQSVVKLTIEADGLFSAMTSFGSGVIFKKETNPVKHFGYQMYDYYILTNYHVISNHISNNRFSGKISIHYDKIDNIYPKFIDKAVVVGWYTNDTDIAIIKLTSTNPNIQVLEDEQFTTKTPVDLEDGQVVFLIGSPVTKALNSFNLVQEGIILDKNSVIRLKNETILCQNGCQAIQTSAFLGPGSSGGGVFDSNGHLIGIHFAGDEDLNTSSEIPMSKVLEAIDYILNRKVELFIEVPLFFILDSQAD